MPKITGKLCPMTKTGSHQLSPWYFKEDDRAGLACVKCHKSWTYVGDNLVPPYDD